jgi:type IV pilus assembly protein PilV
MKTLEYCQKRCVFVTIPRGFSLIEVLVALVVVTIGLLGVAAMQTLALTAGQGGYLRTQAVFQTYDMMDRLRANPTGLAAGLYDNIPDTPGTQPASCSPACAADQVRDFDRHDWNIANQNLLPNGRGTVTSPDSNTFTINVLWDDRSNQGDASLTQAQRDALVAQQFTMTVTLR